MPASKSAANAPSAVFMMTPSSCSPHSLNSGSSLFDPYFLGYRTFSNPRLRLCVRARAVGDLEAGPPRPLGRVSRSAARRGELGPQGSSPEPILAEPGMSSALSRPCSTRLVTDEDVRLLRVEVPPALGAVIGVIVIASPSST
jgi:hypothetical protein